MLSTNTYKRLSMEKKKSAICLMTMATEPIDPTALKIRLLIGRIHGNTIYYRATGHA